MKLYALCGVLLISAASASPGDCYAIADPDARALCLARAHGDPGRCYAIQDRAKRAACLAEVRSGGSLKH